MNGRKRALLIWAGAFALLAAAAFILSMVLRGIQDGEESDPGGYIPYSEYDFFYEPDWESALYERDCYDEYLQHDRTLYYTDGALTRAVTESDRASFPEDVLFFEDYFASLEAGDSKAYDALFDPAFIAENGETPDFTPQMTYGRRVERVRDVSLEGAQEAVFDLRYKFFMNDGTFRRDVYSDSERTIRVTLGYVDGKLKIVSLQYYTLA